MGSQAGPEPAGQDEVFERVSAVVLAVTSQLSVRDVLQMIVRSARSLAGARYAALGVPDDRGGFAEFVVDGISARQQADIGPLPRPARHAGGDPAGRQAAAAGRHQGRSAVRGLVAGRASGPDRRHRGADPGRRPGGRRARPPRPRLHLRRQQTRPRRLHRAGRARAHAVRRARRDRPDERPAVRARPRAVGAGGTRPAGAGPARRGRAEAVQRAGEGAGGGAAGGPGSGQGRGRDRQRRGAGRPGARGAARGHRRAGAAGPVPPAAWPGRSAATRC